MGSSRSSESFSLALELVAVLALAFLVGAGVSLFAARLIVIYVDPLSHLAPAPLFQVPALLLIAMGASLIALAMIGGTLAQWAAGRGDFARVMRFGD